MLLENNPYPNDPRVRKEANTLTTAGYQVSVVCQSKRGQPRTETINGVQIYRYPPPPEINGLFGYLLEYGYSLLIGLLYTVIIWFKHRFDVIHAHNPPEIYVFIALLFKPFGVKFVFDHHDLSPEVYQAKSEGKGNRWVYQTLLWMERVTLKNADHVIATNRSYRRIEMERGGVPAEKITIVRNGPDPARFRRIEPVPEIRQKGKFILGYAGEMHVQDGLDYLMRALAHLRHDLRFDDFYCILMGDGSQIENLKEMAADLDITDHICFTGRLSGEAYIQHLSSVDIFLDPDPSNSFNDHSTMIKMTEYMAIGRPIVAFDLPEHRFSAQESAIYVPNNNEMRFAEAILGLTQDRERRDLMGWTGRQRIENALAWKYSAQQLIHAYEQVLPLPQLAGTYIDSPSEVEPIKQINSVNF